MCLLMNSRFGSSLFHVGSASSMPPVMRETISFRLCLVRNEADILGYPAGGQPGNMGYESPPAQHGKTIQLEHLKCRN